jgi:membrane protein
VAAFAAVGGWWFARRRPRPPIQRPLPSHAGEAEESAEQASTGLQVVGSLVAPALTALAQAQVRKALAAAQNSTEAAAHGFVPQRRQAAAQTPAATTGASAFPPDDCLPATARPTTDPSLWGMLKRAALDWLADDCPRLGAALAFYALFSLAPTLILVTALASALFGPDAVAGKIEGQLDSLIGDQGAEAVQSILVNARQSHGGTTATLLGVATLLIGATAAFGELKAALNLIWHAQRPSGSGLWGIVRDRLLAFVVVLLVGALLLGSVVLSTAISALEAAATNLIPGEELAALDQAWLRDASQVWLVKAGNLALSLVVFTLLFAVIFRILPDRYIAWRDVWLGAAVTAGLFTLGKHLIGLYLAHASVGSTYGAAGSIAVLLLWTYYSAQILFFGAEFTKVYAFRPGSATLQRA